MTTYALIGAAGYIAPRHMQAIKETGGTLVAAMDPNDSVGVLDSYFPQAQFFVEFERFDRYIEKLRQDDRPIDYLVVCSPNYLHDSHCRYGLRAGLNVICEKPLALNPWNVDPLMVIQKATDRRVFSILQLRFHPAIQQLKDTVRANDNNRTYQVDLNYVVPRGAWYQTSWKGDISKSGGIITNIGIHFFDVLLWIFGPCMMSHVSRSTNHTATGTLRLQHAQVTWHLSIKPDNGKWQSTRRMTVDHEELDFTAGFEQLHTMSYHRILGGNGYSIADALPAVALVSALRAQMG
ncbi:MAG: Gfo/Idh/MocA family oxidoreductase [Bacteroidota bacterium]